MKVRARANGKIILAKEHFVIHGSAVVAAFIGYTPSNFVSLNLLVLGSKYQNRLLEVLDSSQLPDFLGGTCSCPNEEGCLRSNKGPWHDRELMKLVNAGDLGKSSSFYDNVDLKVKSTVSESTSTKLSDEPIANTGLPRSMSLRHRVGDATKDLKCWERPEDMDTAITVLKIDRNTPVAFSLIQDTP